METRVAATDFPDGLPLVDGSIVPDHNHGSAKVTEQMSEKLADLGMLDVFPMQHVIQAAVEAPRTDGQRRDH